MTVEAGVEGRLHVGLTKGSFHLYLNKFCHIQISPIKMPQFSKHVKSYKNHYTAE